MSNDDFAETTPRRWLTTRAILILLAYWSIPLLVLFGLLWLAATSAKAEGYESHYVTRRVAHRSCDWVGNCEVYYTYVRRRRPTYEPRVYAYERREPSDREYDRSGGGCRDMRRVVGDQHLTLDGAKKAANDSWAGAIRFHLGEKFMDLSNAREIEYVCSRSSIKEGGTSITTLGQSLTRCEIKATPCAPAREKDER